MKADDKPVSQANRPTSTRRRGDYVKPALIRYGNIAKITAGSGSKGIDNATKHFT